MKKPNVCVFFLTACLSVFVTSDGQSMGNTLYDNGPLVTSTGTGIGGADESVLQNNTLSMTSLGTAHQSSANLRVADDFTVPAEGWNISSIDFFAYQTNQTASTITSINLRIWDGIPADPGSQIIFGDTSTNILSSTSNSGILRVDESSQGNDNTRQIARSQTNVNITLEPGTYWLDWQSDGSGGSGPFVPHITITGQDTTGNALLSTNNGVSYANLQDNGTLTNQGLPFIINGIAGTIQEPQVVPTLSSLGIVIFILLFLISYRHQRKFISNNINSY